MTLPIGPIFITDENGNLLIDGNTDRFIIYTDGTPPVAPVGDSIAYVFQFDDIAQAQGDDIVGPFMIPGNGAQELLVFADVTVNSVTPQSGFWLLLILKGGVQGQLYFHPNIELCFDLALINAGTAVIGTNVDTTHICMVVDNYSAFIQNGVS